MSRQKWAAFRPKTDYPMRYTKLLVFASCLLTGARAERLPVEDFAHEEAYFGMALSPDGKALAYDETIRAQQRLFILDLETKKKVFVEMEKPDRVGAHYSEFFWTSSRRVAFWSGYRYLGVDRDGKNAKNGVATGDALHLFRDDESAGMLTTAAGVGGSKDQSKDDYYGVYRPGVLWWNTRIGTFSIREQNPGNVVAWGANARGVVCVAVEIKGTKYRTVFRATEGEPWAMLRGMDWSDSPVWPLGISPDDKTLYVTRLTEKGTWAVYPYDLVNSNFGEPLLASERYDIIPGEAPAGANGLSYQRALFDPKTRELLGFRYHTDRPKVLWINRDLGEVQAGLDAALPGKINTIVSMSDDHTRITLLSWSANDPGTYFLFDRTKQSLSKLMARKPWIKPEQMAEVQPVKFKARDGLSLQGYLTMPQGRPLQNLPLIVVTRNNLWSRETWQFDSFNQFLANRGYLVLQVNTRGSTGYGEVFHKAGRRQLGEATLSDYVDGVRWAISQGAVDPRRVAIIGYGEFGGYSALMNLAREPDFFRCGAAITPLVDLTRYVDPKWSVGRDLNARMIEWIGDPQKEQALLASISPLTLADRIKAPTLLIHDKEYRGFDYKKTKEMAEALRKSGNAPTLVDEFGDEHFGYQKQAKYLKSIEEFLAKHMPAE